MNGSQHFYLKHTISTIMTFEVNILEKTLETMLSRLLYWPSGLMFTQSLSIHMGNNIST